MHGRQWGRGGGGQGDPSPHKFKGGHNIKCQNLRVGKKCRSPCPPPPPPPSVLISFFSDLCDFRGPIKKKLCVPHGLVRIDVHVSMNHRTNKDLSFVNVPLRLYTILQGRFFVVVDAEWGGGGDHPPANRVSFICVNLGE